MAGADLLPSSAGNPSAAGRIGLALAVSAAFHLLVGAAFVVETPLRSVHTGAAVAITARLKAPPVVESNAAGHGDHHAEPQAGQKAGEIDDDAWRTTPAGVAVHSSSVALAFPQASDPTYYPAHELDSYPRLVAPLNFDNPASIAPDGVPGKAQLMLQINEHGTVDRVSIVELEPRGRFEEALRAVLLQTQFRPALKDGRPVRSRILLSISFAAAGETMTSDR